MDDPNHSEHATTAIDDSILKEVVELVDSIEHGEFGTENLEAYSLVRTEEEIAHHVRAGEIVPLLSTDVPLTIPPLAGVSQVEHLRYLLIAFNAICLHSALEGGVSLRMGYGLNVALSSRILTCTTEDELLELSHSHIIPVSYGMLVRTLAFPDVSDKDVVRAIRYIHDHHHDKVTVRELAEHVGLSTEYFSAKFKRETGMTVNAYITQMRIGEAKALLRFSDLSIGEIAAQLSFSSQSYFQTVFKRETGMTPQQYRSSVEA